MDDKMEQLHQSKNYLTELARGYDPLSGSFLPNDSVLNNIKISRCFHYAANVMQDVIDNGGEISRYAKRGASSRLLPYFTITEEEKRTVELSEEPILISKFCDKINAAVDTENMRKLKVIAFGKWLVDKELLTVETIDGKQYKKATPKGESIGIICEFRTYGDREYYALTYDIGAQRYLLDHLGEIIKISNGE